MDVIKSYNSRYSHSCWHLIYQADVRMRLEHAERIRRRGEAEFTRAASAGKHRDFDSANQWEWVWSVIPEEQRFWREELEEPCMLVLARSGSLSSMVQGDAPVSSDGGTGGSPGKRARSVPDSSRVPPSPKVHNVSDGIYSTSRRGVRLCEEFQNGLCEGVDLNARCKKNSDGVHQCSRCLGADHCAKDCNKTPRPPSLGKGKGKGKGGRKGNQGKIWQY